MIEAIRELARHGQSVWYDGLKRDLIRSGALARLVEDGVRGLTTNPSIYEKAIGGTHDYDADIASLAARGHDAKAIYEAVAIQDLRAAADLLRPVWDATNGMRDLRDHLIFDLGVDSVRGWILFAAVGVSDDGKTIAGIGLNPQGEYEGWVAVLGQPSCYADCNGDGQLNLADFGCFQTKFALGCP